MARSRRFARVQIGTIRAKLIAEGYAWHSPHVCPFQARNMPLKIVGGRKGDDLQLVSCGAILGNDAQAISETKLSSISLIIVAAKKARAA